MRFGEIEVTKRGPRVLIITAGTSSFEPFAAQDQVHAISLEQAEKLADQIKAAIAKHRPEEE